MVLTFDDGFRDFHSAAWPVLREFDFGATLFLPTAFIAEGGARRRKFRGRACLSWPEVAELNRRGIELGSHTASHPTLTELSWPEIESELAISKSEIESRLGCAVTSFSYPFAFPQLDAGFCARFRDALVRTGLRGLRHHGDRLRAAAGDDPYRLKRLPVNDADDPELFAAKLAGDPMTGWPGPQPQRAAKALRRVFRANRWIPIKPFTAEARGRGRGEKSVIPRIRKISLRPPRLRGESNLTNMDLSIIIINWNSAAYVRKCLATRSSPAADGQGRFSRSSWWTTLPTTIAGAMIAARVSGQVRIRPKRGEHRLRAREQSRLPAQHRPRPALSQSRHRGRRDRRSGSCSIICSGAAAGRARSATGFSTPTAPSPRHPPPPPQTSGCVQSFPTILNQVLDSDFLRRLFPRSSLWGVAPLYSRRRPRRPGRGDRGGVHHDAARGLRG